MTSKEVQKTLDNDTVYSKFKRYKKRLYKSSQEWFGLKLSGNIRKKDKHRYWTEYKKNG